VAAIVVVSFGAGVGSTLTGRLVGIVVTVFGAGLKTGP